MSWVDPFTRYSELEVYRALIRVAKGEDPHEVLQEMRHRVSSPGDNPCGEILLSPIKGEVRK